MRARKTNRAVHKKQFVVTVNMYLPVEIWELIHGHRASMTIQRCTRRKNAARLHYGHVHSFKWIELREFLTKSNVIHRIYPFPLARKEWRTEMDSWCQKHVDVQELVKDMEGNTYWGLKSPILSSAILHSHLHM